MVGLLVGTGISEEAGLGWGDGEGGGGKRKTTETGASWVKDTLGHSIFLKTF